jgi:hypothetical protein
MIDRALGTEPSTIRPTSTTTDLNHPELRMKAFRDENICKMLPHPYHISVLRAHQRAFRRETNSRNTIYACGDSLLKDMILLKAHYGLGNVAFCYLFWASTMTKIGELADIWYAAQFGSAWEVSEDGIPVIKSTWTFNGRPIHWTDRWGS